MTDIKSLADAIVEETIEVELALGSSAVIASSERTFADADNAWKKYPLGSRPKRARWLRMVQLANSFPELTRVCALAPNDAWERIVVKTLSDAVRNFLHTCTTYRQAMQVFNELHPKSRPARDALHHAIQFATTLAQAEEARDRAEQYPSDEHEYAQRAAVRITTHRKRLEELYRDTDAIIIGGAAWNECYDKWCAVTLRDVRGAKTKEDLIEICQSSPTGSDAHHAAIVNLARVF